MYYYEVLVSQEYTSLKSVFTYSSEAALQQFQFVSVPLQRKTTVGIVVKKVPKPSFETKQIVRAFASQLTPTQRYMIRFLQSYYGATEAQTLELFVPSYLAKLDKLELAHPNPHAALDLPPLTKDQSVALRLLVSHTDGTVLLHGETGTGKTRLYLERAKAVLANGKSVLILAPEIALIPQLTKIFKAQFGDSVASYHSTHTTTERAKVWAGVQAGSIKVIVGTRSALFLPLQNIGLIVVDEAHEPAYKQEDGVRYHASRLASVIATHQKAQLILASATPLVADVYMAQQKQRPIVRMSTPAIASQHKTDVSVIDMKSRADFTKHPLLSTALLKAVETALQQGEQTLIYLNRRGTARTILCHNCGWQAMCPTCDINLTYHHDAFQLRCHTCGYTAGVPTSCPNCHGSEIIFKTAGTKALAEWLQTHFPHAKVARFDTDNTKAESLHERHTDVASGAIDILVGTQMLVKGLDLPNLAVVGIVAADASLQIPDFSAEERTYQLLTQAIGRVGRGHRDGRVIIQTFNPQTSVIKDAIAKNYEAFYTTQIKQRLAYHYPPIFSIATLWCSRKSSASALTAAKKLLPHLSKIAQKSEFLGPVVTYHPKKRGYVTAQIVVKTKQRSELNTIISALPSGWQYDLEPTNLL